MAHAFCWAFGVHLIIGRHGEPLLESIIRDIKKFTSSKIIEAIRVSPQESRKKILLMLFEQAGIENSNNIRYPRFNRGQQHNHPFELSTNEIIDQRLNHLHNNPVGAG